MTRQTLPKPSTRSPHDFPRGLAESSSPGYREFVHLRRRERDPNYVIPPRPEFYPLLLNLKYGEVFDAGMEYYGEFFVNLEYGWDLLQNGLAVEGVEGTVQVIERFTNGVQLKWTPL